MEKQDIKGVSFKWLDDSGVPGTYLLCGVHSNYPAPISFISVRWSLKSSEIEVLSSFVNECYRRIGVRSKAQDFIFSSFDTCQKIVTQSGTCEGKKWMRAKGYKQLKSHWEISRASWRRNQKAI